MKKRLISVLLALCLTAGLLPVSADTTVAAGTCGTNVSWSLDSDGTLTVSGQGPMDDYIGFWVIPWRKYSGDILAVVIEDGVTSIGSAAFIDDDADENPIYPNLEQVTVAASVKTIGYAAFRHNPLRSVSLSEGLEQIGEDAFSFCENLTSIVIPDSVTDLGEMAFDNCASLTRAVVGKGVTTIRQHTFSSCENLRSLVLGSNVKVIEDYAFEWCAHLTDFQLPPQLETIGANAFEGCSCSNSAEGTFFLTIPATVTDIGRAAFRNCPRMTGVTLPEGITVIEPYTFADCEALTEIRIPEGVVSIGEGAFEEDIGLTCAYIPLSVKSIGAHAFFTWYNDHRTFRDVYYAGTAEQWAEIEIGEDNDELLDRVKYGDVTIHFNSSAGGGEGSGSEDGGVETPVAAGSYTISPMDFGELIVNGSGKASAFFRVTDEKGIPVTGAALSYCFVKDDQAGEFIPVTSDKNGVVEVKLPEQTKVGSQTYRIWLDSAKAEVNGSAQTVTVKVKKPSYAQEWTGGASVGVEGGAGAGIGGKVGPAEAKASLVEASIGLGMDTALSVSIEYENGSRTLTLQSSDGLNGGLSWESGLGVHLRDRTKITPLTPSVSGKVAGTMSYGLKLENYDPDDREQRKKIASFLLYRVYGSSSVFLQMFAQALNPDCNQVSGTVSAILSGDLKSFSVSRDGLKGALANLGSTTVYSQTGTLDLTDSEPLTSTTSVVTDVGAGLFSGTATAEGLGGITYTVGSKSYIFGLKKSNHKEVSVTRDRDENITGASYRVYDGDERSLSLLEYTTDIYSRVKYRGDEVVALVENSKELSKVADDSIFVNIQGAIDELSVSGLAGLAEETTKVKRGMDYELPIGFQMGEKLEVSAGLSGEWSYSWNDKSSALYQGREYVTTVSNLSQEQVRSGLDSLPDLLADAMTSAGEDLLEDISSIAGTISDGILDTYHSIRQRKTEPYERWYARLRSFVLEEILRPGSFGSYAVTSLRSETEALTEASLAATIGPPCMATIFSDDSCTRPVSDEELAAAEAAGFPVELTMRYTDEMLENAGIELGEGERLPEVMIFRFDPERNCYIRIPGSEDRAAKTVTAAITRNGEYILAVDTVSPILTNFEMETENLTPTFSVRISDMSGLQELRLWLEKEVEEGGGWTWEKAAELMTPETFAQFCLTSAEDAEEEGEPENRFTLLRYAFRDPLEADVRYRLCYQASDTAGNGMEELDVCGEFCLSSAEEIVGSLCGPADKVCTSAPFSVDFSGSTEDLDCVFLLCEGENGFADTLSMTRAYDEVSGHHWTASLMPPPGEARLTLTAFSYDWNGNIRASEPAVVLLDLPAEETEPVLHSESGYLGAELELYWIYNASTGLLSVAPADGEDPFENGRTLWVACYGPGGQMRQIRRVTDTTELLELASTETAFKIFWLNADGSPLCGNAAAAAS